MVIKVVMIIFIFLLLLTSWYLWHRRNGHFLIFDVGGDPRLSNILKWTSIALGNKYLNLITLFLASLTILVFGLSITGNKE